MSTLRLGIAGCGRLACRYYAPGLRRISDVEIVAVADPLAASRDRASLLWPAARRFATLDEMLGEGALEALLVASPPSAHLAAWRAARTAGVPLLVEKPLLLANELPLINGTASAASDEPLMVDFNRRFWPPYARARECVASGTLGSPVELEFQLHLDVLGWSTVTGHRLEAGEGGIAHDLGSHALDLATWMLGEPCAIRAVASSERWPNDHLRIELRFVSGARATADLAYGRRTRERLRVSGPHGRLWLDEPNLALHVEPAGSPRPRIAVLARDVATLAYRGLRRSRSSARGSVHAALAAFVAAVRSEAAFTPGVEDGLRNASHVAAALRSAARGGDEIELSGRAA